MKSYQVAREMLAKTVAHFDVLLFALELPLPKQVAVIHTEVTFPPTVAAGLL